MSHKNPDKMSERELRREVKRRRQHDEDLETGAEIERQRSQLQDVAGKHHDEPYEVAP